MGIAADLYDFRWFIALAALAAYLLQKTRAYYRLRSFQGPWSTGWSDLWHSWAILSLKSHLKYDEACRKYGKENVGLEESIDVHVAEFVQLFRSSYISTDTMAKPVDFAKKVQYLSLDVISDISWGKPFGNLKGDRDVDGIAHSSEEGMWFFNFMLATGLYRILHQPLIAPYVGVSVKDATGFGRLLYNARDIIHERLQRDAAHEKRSDMIASFFRHGLSEDQILSETTLQMVAGADTTASSIATTLLYLMTHPRVYEKLQCEIDDASNRVSSTDDGRVISDADARKLPYLQAVIKESMRIHAPVTNASPKRVPDGGDTVVIDGRSIFIPGGTNISYAVWTHRLNRRIFGEDAASFRPERWLLEKDEERLADMNRVHELGFGHGRYQCLGKFIASMEIGKTIFEMMRNFDWSLARPDQPWTEGSYGGILAHKDMWVLVSERKGLAT
ncbi:hypothetical protein PG997_012859 [Apiospora hydei]|uniref:Pisatin demethylase n=1 Tax=Apiospora hydei TaxID=1337664 RepID=A0ABR1V5D1_9PEZI